MVDSHRQAKLQLIQIMHPEWEDIIKNSHMYAISTHKQRQWDNKDHMLGPLMVNSIIFFKLIQLLCQLEVLSELIPSVFSIANFLLEMILYSLNPMLFGQKRRIIAVLFFNETVV